MKPSLCQLVSEALKQQEEAGFAQGTISLSRRVFNRLLAMAESLGCSDFSDDLASAFVADTVSVKTGRYCHTRYRLHNVAIARLKAIQNCGRINWLHNRYIFPNREMPNSPEYQNLLENYLDHLREDEKHDNTIDSYRNVAVKFLIFCENKSIRNINEVAPGIIPLFF